MKRIIIILIASIFLTQTIDAQVQFLGSPTTTIRNRGNFVSDSLFYLPKRQKLPTDTGAARYSISDSTMYLWTGSQWIKSGISKQDTSSMLSPYIRAAGYGLTKSGQSLLVDTLNIATRAWRQKGIDSVVSIIPAAGVGGSGTTNYVAKFTAGSTIGNSQIFDNGNVVGINTNNPTINGGTGSGALHIAGTGSNWSMVHYTTDTTGNTGGDGMLVGTFGDRNMQIFNYEAGNISFSTSAAERMRIFANGRIGINTTTDAGYQLDVNGTLRSVNDAYFATTSGNVGVGTAAPNYKFNILSGGGSANIFAASQTGVSNGYTIISDGTNLTHTWYNAGTESLQLKAGSELLINTTTDAGDYKLQVAGNIYNTGSAVLAATSGNVGIGTASPITNLDVNGFLAVGPATKPASVLGLISMINQRFLGNDPQTYAATSSAVGQNILNGYFLGLPSAYARVLDIAAVGVPDGSSGGGIIRFLTNPITLNSPSVERMRITSEGNVGIGTASPGVKLDVAGRIASEGITSNEFVRVNKNGSDALGSGPFFALYDAAFTNAIFQQLNASNGLDWRSTAANLMRLSTNAELLINTTTDAGDYKLQVNGNGYFKNGQILLDSVTNKSALFASQHSVTGSASTNMFSGTATWNTTGNPNLIYIELTNTASGTDADYIRITDGSNMFRVTKDAGIVTSNPTGSTASKWKLGSVSGGTVTLNTGQYVTVEIAGATYKLAIVN